MVEPILKKRSNSHVFYLKYGPDLEVDRIRRTVVTPKLELYKRPKIEKTSGNLLKKLKWLFLGITMIVATLAFSKILVPYIKPSEVHPTAAAKKELFDVDLIPDYALASAGAEILGKPLANPYNTRVLKLNLFTLLDWSLEPDFTNPSSILKPWKSPGECWAFAGSKATVVIRLSHTIIPQAVTIDHIGRDISPAGHIASAPKLFSVYAVEDAESTVEELLGTFMYRSDGQAIQTFFLEPKQFYPINIIKFMVHSNHGHHLYTCVYKIRVHGEVFYI